MTQRFSYELIIGIIGLVAVFLLGNAGMAVLALLAAYPFFGKRNADEREIQLFYKTGNITAAFTLLACVVIYLASDIRVNGIQIGK